MTGQVTLRNHPPLAHEAESVFTAPKRKSVSSSTFNKTDKRPRVDISQLSSEIAKKRLNLSISEAISARPESSVTKQLPHGVFVTYTKFPNQQLVSADPLAFEIERYSNESTSTINVDLFAMANSHSQTLTNKILNTSNVSTSDLNNACIPMKVPTSTPTGVNATLVVPPNISNISNENGISREGCLHHFTQHLPECWELEPGASDLKTSNTLKPPKFYLPSWDGKITYIYNLSRFY